MCHALYIASSQPLPLVGWDEQNPGFHTTQLQEHEELVRKQFTLPFVAYAGSFEGCSCGFVYDDEPIDDDEFEIEYDRQSRESVRQLGLYISDLLEKSEVEIFSCWEGEHVNPPLVHLNVGMEFFSQKVFGFEESTLVSITK